MTRPARPFSRQTRGNYRHLFFQLPFFLRLPCIPSTFAGAPPRCRQFGDAASSLQRIASRVRLGHAAAGPSGAGFPCSIGGNGGGHSVEELPLAYGRAIGAHCARPDCPVGLKNFEKINFFINLPGSERGGGFGRDFLAKFLLEADFVSVDGGLCSTGVGTRVCGFAFGSAKTPSAKRQIVRVKRRNFMIIL